MVNIKVTYMVGTKGVRFLFRSCMGFVLVGKVGQRGGIVGEKQTYCMARCSFFPSNAS